MDPIPLLLGPGARGNEWGVEEGEPAPTFLPPQNHEASDEVPFSCGGKRRGGGRWFLKVSAHGERGQDGGMGRQEVPVLAFGAR